MCCFSKSVEEGGGRHVFCCVIYFPAVPTCPPGTHPARWGAHPPAWGTQALLHEDAEPTPLRETGVLRGAGTPAPAAAVTLDGGCPLRCDPVAGEKTGWELGCGTPWCVQHRGSACAHHSSGQAWGVHRGVHSWVCTPYSWVCTQENQVCTAGCARLGVHGWVHTVTMTGCELQHPLAVSWDWRTGSYTGTASPPCACGATSTGSSLSNGSINYLQHSPAYWF